MQACSRNVALALMLMLQKACQTCSMCHMRHGLHYSKVPMHAVTKPALSMYRITDIHVYAVCLPRFAACNSGPSSLGCVQQGETRLNADCNDATRQARLPFQLVAQARTLAV